MHVEVRTWVCPCLSTHTQTQCAPLPSCSFGGLDQTAVPLVWTELTLFWKRHAQHIVQRSLSLSGVLSGRTNKRHWKHPTLAQPATTSTVITPGTRSSIYLGLKGRGTNALGMQLIIISNLLCSFVLNKLIMRIKQTSEIPQLNVMS